GGSDGGTRRTDCCPKIRRCLALQPFRTRTCPEDTRKPGPTPFVMWSATSITSSRINENRAIRALRLLRRSKMGIIRRVLWTRRSTVIVAAASGPACEARSVYARVRRIVDAADAREDHSHRAAGSRVVDVNGYNTSGGRHQNNRQGSSGRRRPARTVDDDAGHARQVVHPDVPPVL